MALALPTGMCGSHSVFPVLCGGKGVGAPFWQQQNLDRCRAQGINPCRTTKDSPTVAVPNSCRGAGLVLPGTRAALWVPRGCVTVGDLLFQWGEFNTSVDPKL